MFQFKKNENKNPEKCLFCINIFALIKKKKQIDT